jgi:hypothetical protein
MYENVKKTNKEFKLIHTVKPVIKQKSQKIKDKNFNVFGQCIFLSFFHVF